MEGVCGGPQNGATSGLILYLPFFPSTETLKVSLILFHASHVAQSVKNLPAMQKTCVQFLGWVDTLEKDLAPHSSILARRIPEIEDPGRLQSMGSQESDTT